MWKYEKRLQFPVNIKNPNATLAQAIMSQYGGPDGELGASMRYLSQRYSEYYGAAEPPVRCGESHLSGLTEPLRSL